MSIEHTQIEFMGLVLTDPFTFVSDLMMGAVCFYCGHRLYHDFSLQYSKYFSFFFLLLGISASIGGTAHLFIEYGGKIPHLVAWHVQGLSILAACWAVSFLFSSTKKIKALRIASVVLFLIFLYRLNLYQVFDPVKVNSAIGLLGFVGLMHVRTAIVNRSSVYALVPLAIIAFSVPALSHALGLKVNDWINSNVVSHIILLPCYYFLYRAIARVSSLKLMEV